MCRDWVTIVELRLIAATAHNACVELLTVSLEGSMSVEIHQQTELTKEGLMKHKLFTLTLSAMLMTTLVVADQKQEKKKRAKRSPLAAAKCPVSGGKVKEASTVAYKGGKVYFCCDNCPKKFSADTAKFANKANHQLVVTRQMRCVKCPISGGELNKETTIRVAGARVQFCCNKCKAKAEAAKGDEQVAMLFSDAALKKGFKAVKAKKKAAPKKSE